MKEFVDRERESREEFQRVKDLFREGKIEEVKNGCLQLIERDPYYLEPYVLLHDIYEMEGDLRSAERVLEDALQKAEELIAPEGRYPDRLLWKHENNRHIIRTLITAGTFYWELGELDKALEILRKVYSMNPEDEPGVRFYILAILEGMSLQEYEQVFVKEGKPDLEDLERWFRKLSQEHPEYFPKQDI